MDASRSAIIHAPVWYSETFVGSAPTLFDALGCAPAPGILLPPFALPASMPCWPALPSPDFS